MTSPTPWMSAVDLARAYGPVRALAGVTIGFAPGEVHAVVGENGAGKSTLMRLLAGEERPDAGEIRIDGEAVTLAGPLAARGRGIAVVHQTFQLVETLTVAENLLLGRVPVRRGFGPLSVIDRPATRREALRRLAPFGLEHRADRPVRDLPVGERQIVEIARAMDEGVRLLILDEPTASLGAAETARLLELVAGLRRRGAAIVLIAHNLDEVLSVADRVTVLRNGRLIGTRARAELDHGELVRMILGRELAHGYPKAATVPGPVVLAGGAALTDAGRPRPLEIRSGEILGVPTYVGAGVDAVFDGLIGAGAGRRGALWLRGRPLGRRGSSARIRAGLSPIPGDPLREGLVPGFSIEDNILLANQARFSVAGWVDRAGLRAVARDLIRELDIRPADPSVPVGRLSGGNRQKVAIAKWLARDVTVFLMNDPTKAVDVGAKAEIYRLLGRVVSKGAAVLLISSELDELVGLSDRVVVLRGREILDALSERPFDKARILSAMLGRKAASFEAAAA